MSQAEDKIKTLIRAWRILSNIIEGILQTAIPAPVERRGEENLQLLVDPAGAPDTLEAALSDYEYRKDPMDGVIDYATPPVYTAAFKRGDCEDSAFLIDEVFRQARGEQNECKVIIFFEMDEEGNYPILEGPKAHTVTFDTQTGTCYSNFGISGSAGDFLNAGTDNKKIFKRYMEDDHPDYTYMVEIDENLIVKDILERDF